MVPLTSNPQEYVASAVMLVILGGLGSIGWWLYNAATDWFWRAFLVTITVRKPDRPYEWIADWLTANRHRLISASNLTLSAKELETDRRGRPSADSRESEVANAKDMKLLPGDGLHLFSFKGKWIWLTRTTGAPVQNGLFGKPIITETVTVSMLGTSSKVIEELFLEAWQQCIEVERGGTKIYVLADGYEWRVALTRPPRALESVILDGDLATRIVDDLKLFFASREWYLERGIPYRRGVMLHGPPGTGKTSFITAIAGALHMNICILNLSNKRIDDEDLITHLMDAPQRSIILLEDVDAVFHGRSAASSDDSGTKPSSSSSVTFSGLLNALDGVASQEGRILFMTTNHLEKLDPALIRPGRVDLQIRFDLASADQAKRMFLRFYPTETTLAKEITSVLAERSVSPAALQGHFLKHRDRPLEAVKTLGSLLVASGKSSLSAHASAAHLTIGMWLKRLALPQRYGETLRAMKVVFVGDLKILGSSEVVSVMDIKNEIHKARVNGFLDDDEFVKQAFALAKLNVVEQLFVKHYHNATRQQVERFVSLVGADVLSSFEIENYLGRFIDRPEAAISEIDDLIEEAGATSDRAMMTRSKRGATDISVHQWLISLGLSADVIKKFEDEKITDMDQVLQFDESDLTQLGIEKKGDLYRVKSDLERRQKIIELCV